MSKRTIILLILLILISLILIFTASTQKKSSSKPLSVTKPVVEGHTVLSLNSTDPHTLSLDIDTAGDNVTAVQAEVLYDPKKVENVHVQQGSFFTDPIVLSNRVVQSNGRLSYAIGILPLHQPQKGSGTVATISYDVVEGTKDPITFTFLPKTQVTALGIATSVLKTANNATITPVP